MWSFGIRRRQRAPRDARDHRVVRRVRDADRVDDALLHSPFRRELAKPVRRAEEAELTRSSKSEPTKPRGP